MFSLTPGNIVTTPRSDVMYLVTEFGLVNLKGRSVAGPRQSDHLTFRILISARTWNAGLREPVDSSRCFVFLTRKAWGF